MPLRWLSGQPKRCSGAHNESGLGKTLGTLKAGLKEKGAASDNMTLGRTIREKGLRQAGSRKKQVGGKEQEGGQGLGTKRREGVGEETKQ